MKTTKVVIVGGGFGGVRAALNLANKPGFAVQLISDNTHFEYHGALSRSAVGSSPMEIVIPLKDIFSNAHNVELVFDSAGFIDASQKRLASLTGNVYPYDVIIFSLGNTVNHGLHPKLEKHTETLYSVLSTSHLRKQLATLFAKPHAATIRVAIVGGGISGVELAAEIPQFARFAAKKHGLPTPKVKTIVVEKNERILPTHHPKTSTKVAKRLSELGVELHLNITVESCEEGLLCMSAGNLNADIIIWATGNRPPDFYANNPETFVLGLSGNIVVDEHLAVPGHNGVYVIGDNAETPYAGMAQTALYDANFVTRNLLLAQAGKKPKAYRPKKPVYAITAGKNWALLEDGKQIIAGKRGWLLRRRADLALFELFAPYEQAIKTWRKAKKLTGA